jgi:hypothetical protein
MTMLSPISGRSHSGSTEQEEEFEFSKMKAWLDEEVANGEMNPEEAMSLLKDFWSPDHSMREQAALRFPKRFRNRNMRRW